MKAYILLLLLPFAVVLAHPGHTHKEPEKKHVQIKASELSQLNSFIDSIDEIATLLEMRTRDAFSIPEEEALECHKYLVDRGAFRQKKVNGEVEIYVSAQFGLASSKQKRKGANGSRTITDIYGVNYVATASVRAGEITISKHEQ